MVKRAYREGLTKHKGVSKDTRGTEFHYTCLNTKYYDDRGKLKKEQVYYCDEFPRIQAKSLSELKKKIGKM